MSAVEEINNQSRIAEASGVVVRFAGDSGDGMQLTGSNFTEATALYGNDLATFPDFPAEIRAPAGATFGVSFLEIYQNCPVYNDGIFDQIKEKKTAAETRLVLEHGKPLTFGVDQSKGLRLNPKTLSLEIAVLGEGGIGIEDIVVHDETNKVLAQLLANLKLPDFPEPIGVIYCDPSEPDFTGEVYDQRVLVRESKGEPDFNALLRTGHTWTVE